MEETSNTSHSGLPEARRSVMETASTPRDKENAGANSSQHQQSQSETVDQSKASTSSTSTTAQAANPPPAKTPARSRLTDQTPRQKVSPSFFSTATTPSPASANANSLASLKDTQQQQQHSLRHTSPATTPAPSSTSFGSANKSPPGTSQVLRKHFQSLGFSTPPGKHNLQLQQQRLLSSGAVRLTPGSRKKDNTKGFHEAMASKRIGFDGTSYTPSKELLKSTASSRNQRVMGLQDISMMMEHQEMLEEQEQIEHQQLFPMQQLPESSVVDDESSTGASAATIDDASFDMSLPSMNQNSYLGNPSNMLPSPNSPLTPRMGCLNPVALTLLNDGNEDYNYLLTQDALDPVPKVEDTMDVSVVSPPPSRSKESSSSDCRSPTFEGKSPADVRATLSQKVRSTLTRPVAILAKSGRVSPSQGHTPRLLMRPQPKHVR